MRLDKKINDLKVGEDERLGNRVSEIAFSDKMTIHLNMIDALIEDRLTILIALWLTQ